MITCHQGQPIRFLEHVTATVSMNYTDVRGKIEITLVSPSGMTSPLLSLRLYDNVPGGRLSWTFMSVHFWGENPIGQWRLQYLVTWLRYNVLLENGDIMSFSVGYCVVCPFSITNFDYPFRMLKLFLGLYLKFGLYLIYSGFSLDRFYFTSHRLLCDTALINSFSLSKLTMV
jgi:hypothetical protein